MVRLRSRLVSAAPIAALLVLATPAFVQQTDNWRGVPRGAFAGPAYPDKGSGDAHPSKDSVLVSVAAAPLETLGDNVIRLSSSPVFAKRGYIIEVHSSGAGPASGTLTILTLGKTRWQLTEVRRFRITSANFQRLSAAVDGMMAENLPIFTGTDEVIVCMDDADFLTERLNAGKKSWLFGDYGPNYRIARALIAADGGTPFDPAPRGYCGSRVHGYED